MTQTHETRPRPGVAPIVVLTLLELAILTEAHRIGTLLEAGELEHATSPPTTPPIPTDARASAAVDEAARAAHAQARSSLQARGLLGADGLVPQDTRSGQVLTTLLDVMALATSVVVVERIVGAIEERDVPERHSTRALHLCDLAAVVQDLTDEGLVALDLLLDPGEAAGALVDVVLPPDVRDASDAGGPDRVLGPAGAESLPDLLDRPTVLVETMVIHPDEDDDPAAHPGPATPSTLLALGPGGCFLAHRTAGAPPTAYRPVSVREIQDHLGSLCR
ncbi:hypothetical protein ACQBAT_10055 [Ornithinimicrobium sp. Y1847]|uniref:hypothetical protein n=1 Tax=Ornithinimicrobium sp. Y1847 TaxID=3405419 RepID=UPI003B67827B